MASYYIFELALGAFILLILLYKYMSSEYSYWKKQNVPYIEPTFPYGNIKDQVTNKTDIGRCFKALYDQMPEERYFGIFELGKPALVLKDLDIIKAVMVTNFDHFVDRGHIHEKVKKDYLAARHLFNLKNDEWRKMRTKLLPTFTSGRMKMMFHYMHQCSERLDNYISKMVKDDNLVEFKDLLSRFTSDVISSCLFGLETNAIEDKDSEVRKISRLVFPTDISTMMKLMLSINHPYIYDLLGLEVNHKKVKQFCMQVAKETYNYRTTNNVYRDDFIDLLIQIKQNKNLCDEKNVNQESRQATENDDGLYHFLTNLSEVLI